MIVELYQYRCPHLGCKFQSDVFEWSGEAAAAETQHLSDEHSPVLEAVAP